MYLILSSVHTAMPWLSVPSISLEIRLASSNTKAALKPMPSSTQRPHSRRLGPRMPRLWLCACCPQATGSAGTLQFQFRMVAWHQQVGLDQPCSQASSSSLGLLASSTMVPSGTCRKRAGTKGCLLLRRWRATDAEVDVQVRQHADKLQWNSY